MSDKSAIEWCDATWNPTTGCTKISPGCANCYIEHTTPFRVKGLKFVNGHIPLTLHDGRLEQPLRWTKPKRIFVNSLSDLFHDDVPDAFICAVFDTMRRATQHTFQLLTKRPARMRTFIEREYPRHMVGLDANWPRFHHWPLPNVWLGVSVENQHFADERIPILLQTPAAVRFISAEPLLEEINIRQYLAGAVALALDWVIPGGESGPNARMTDAGALISLLVQCIHRGVPVFLKQMGSKVWIDENPKAVRKQQKYADEREAAAALADYLQHCHSLTFKHKKGGDPSEWPETMRVRQFPEPRA